MKTINEYKTMLLGDAFDERLKEVYVDASLIPYQKERYQKALDRFKELYGENQVTIFSAPGRSEVSGNHTDHQHGNVLATSLNLDAIAVVSKREDGIIRLVSGDFDMITIDIKDIEFNDAELETTIALIKGVLAGIKKEGFIIGGFDAYVTSDVLMGAGMSSSAAFETLIGTIISGLYNEMTIPAVLIAKIGQYAENVYFGKPCGLMDQMACSVGGLVYIDFENIEDPVIKAVPSDFEGWKYSLCIVDTKGSHADLTDDYAAIPAEMKQVAMYFKKAYLCEVSKDEFLKNIAGLREKTSDRAVLRAMHYFEEQSRVKRAVAYLEDGNIEGFLCMIKQSGDSSSKMLQNIYSPKNPMEQSVTVALSASEIFLGDDGVCRVHGGGFAGTIQAFVKNEAVDTYKASIESIFGEGACHVLKVRPFGGIEVLA